MRTRILVAMTPLVIAAGCAGNVRTSVLEPGALTPGSSHHGVVYYQAQYLKLTYAFTARVEDKNGVVGSAAEGSCVPIVQREEVAVMPDLTRPMLLRNASGFLSASRFAVSLDKGMLESVNVEPSQKVSELMSSSGAIMRELPELLRAPGTGGTAPCNASPRLVAFERLVLK